MKKLDHPQRPIPSSPKRHSYLEGPAHLDVKGKPTRIHVLLDSGASCFLLSEKLVKQLNILYKV